MKTPFAVRTAALCAVLFVGACGMWPGSAPPPPTTRTLTWDFPAGQTTLTIRPVIDGPAAARSVQTLYTRADIDVLLLQVFEVDMNGVVQPLFDASGRRVEAELTGDDLDGTVVFNNLKSNTTYVIKTFAYVVSPSGSRQLISVVDPASWATIPVGTAENIEVTLHIKLVDSGGLTAIGGLAVTDGQYVASGDVFVVVRRNATPSPEPTPAPTPSPTPSSTPTPSPTPTPTPTPTPWPVPTPPPQGPYWTSQSVTFANPEAMPSLSILGAASNIATGSQYFLRYQYDGIGQYTIDWGTADNPAGDNFMFSSTSMPGWPYGAQIFLGGNGVADLYVELGAAPPADGPHSSVVRVE